MTLLKTGKPAPEFCELFQHRARPEEWSGGSPFIAKLAEVWGPGTLQVLGLWGEGQSFGTRVCTDTGEMVSEVS